MSVYYFLKFKENKDFNYVYINIFTCALSAYISPNFSVFSLFFFIIMSNSIVFFQKKIFFNYILKHHISFTSFLLCFFFRNKFSK